MRQVDVMVLGTGPAATGVALKCSEAGRRVAIVDPRPFGGTCALRGCNPKKVLVRAAELHDWIRRAAGTGVQTDGARIDWPELVDFKRSFTRPVTSAKEDRFREAGIDQFHEAPRFVSPTGIAVGDQQVQCSGIVIATGSVPMPLDIPGAQWLTNSDDFLELEELPKRVVFVGGGYITFEFAHVAARAGAQVTILEMAERVLTPFDPDLVASLVAASRELGIDVRTQTMVTSIEKQPDGQLLVGITSGDDAQTIAADLVVHGAGRVPNTGDLDLEAGQVRHGRSGIEVNRYLQSVSNPAVYAAGDVAATGAPPLTPVANEDGRTVVHNLLNDQQREPAYGPVATAVFSVPALAAVGLGEQEASKQGLQFTVNSGDLSENNSMKKVGAKYARYKVLIEKGSGRILGAHLLGPDAAETINLFALAIKHDLTASDLKSSLFVFPTFAHDVRGMV
jgi:glutathione reductase (NADPH)